MAQAQKSVEVTIQPDGEVSIEAFGFAGKGCKEATKSLEYVLAGGGSENVKTDRKPDFFNVSTGRATTTR